VITNQFEKLSPSDEAQKIRDKLLTVLDAMDGDEEEHVAATKLADIRKGGETKGLWSTVRAAKDAWTSSPSDPNWEELQEAMLKLTERVDGPVRYVRLKEADDATEAAKLKKKLIAELRLAGNYVLEKGCLEDYFPEQLSVTDKVDGALDLCGGCATLQNLDESTAFRDELEEILKGCIEGAA
jgi:putative ATP-dependent endonuclease of OLD family